jgi:hypothetical protein
LQSTDCINIETIHGATRHIMAAYPQLCVIFSFKYTKLSQNVGLARILIIKVNIEKEKINKNCNNNNHTNNQTYRMLKRTI